MSSKARGLADLGNAFDDGALSNRNLIINGAMQVAQRGTSVTGATSSGYSTVDRINHNSSGATLDMSRQDFAFGQVDVPSQFKHYFRINATTGANNAGLRYRVEDVQSVPEGKVTLSFYAKGTNPNGGNLELDLSQSFGSGGSTSVSLPAETITLTSSWQRFTYTVTIPSISGKTVGAGSNFQIYCKQPNGDNSTNAWTLDITGIQLEVGDTATPFEHRSYGQELALCQRYYQFADTNNGTYTFGPATCGFTHAPSSIPTSVQLRATPTVSLLGTWTFRQGGSDTSINGVFSTVPASGMLLIDYVLSSSPGNGVAGNILVYGSGAGIKLDAEL